MKDLGLHNNLIELIAADPAFGLSMEELTAHMEPSRYTGRCPEQVEEFLDQCVAPVLSRFARDLQGEDTQLKV